MSTISTKINLTQFKHAVRKMQGQTGTVDCLIIPIDANHFYRGEKGIYVDLVGFELRERRDNQTHLVKQSLPKELLEKMTEQEKNDLPILGSHVVWTQREPDPVRQELQPLENQKDDDLPF
jgi:hypothetical protein